MEKYAQIPQILNGVVFSDPSYDESVWCQYRKDFRDDNWLMKFESNKEDNFISFQMTLGRSTVLAGVKAEVKDHELLLTHPSRYNVQQVELGMDTACIFCGLKDFLEDFGSEAAIRTGTDGTFGQLLVFTCKGEDAPAGFYLAGGLEEIFMDEKELFQHFMSSFNALEVTPEHFAGRINPKALEVQLRASSEMRHAQESQMKPKSPEKENER